MSIATSYLTETQHFIDFNMLHTYLYNYVQYYFNQKCIAETRTAKLL